MPKIIITGGSGKVGQAVIKHLLTRGHDILNLDIAPLPASISQGRVHTMRVDLTDSGQVLSALTSRFHPDCPFDPAREPLNARPDAVIHLAGLPRNMMVPDVETYRVNVMSGFNVLDAACRLGIKKVIVASTVCVYGQPYGEGDVPFPSFPVDEEVDVNPMDTYATSKVCVERTARGFERRFAGLVDVYVFRLAAVIGEDEYEDYFRTWINRPKELKAVGWSYLDSRDFGDMCHLAVHKDGLGFQIFNATNAEITVDHQSTTTEYLKKEAPEVKFTREMGETEAPLTNEKVQRLLGFRQEHYWRDYFSYS